jgi:DNA-binding SARP family transcriptional activator
LADAPVVVRLLGAAEILGPAEAAPVTVITEQAALLLTLLALHPDGVPARTLRELAWPNTTDQARTRVALHTAINRTRTLLRRAAASTAEAGDLITYDKVRQAYRLNSNTVTTDLALARNLTAQAASIQDRIEKLDLLTRAAALHHGELAPSLDDRDRDWLTTARYTILKEAVAMQLQIAEYAIENHPDRAAAAIRAAVTLAPEEHDTIITALRICRRIRRPALAQAIYRKHTDALRHLGESPDPRIDQFLHEFVDSWQPS